MNFFSSLTGGGGGAAAPAAPAAPSPAPAASSSSGQSTVTQRRTEEQTPLVQDVEAPKPKMELEAPPAKAASAFAAASEGDAFAAPPGAANNPVFLAKMIFRKVAVLLLSSDQDDITQPGGIVTFLKDIVVGIILGVLTISFLIFLDHHDVIHLESAHNFRNAAFSLLNDPETIANLEESSDLKFMTIHEYDSKKKEIDGVEEKIANMQTILETRAKEADAKKKEIDEIKGEYDTVYHNPILELDKWCGGCHWGQKFSCDARVNFLQSTYNTRPLKAKISAMSHPSCKKG